MGDMDPINWSEFYALYQPMALRFVKGLVASPDLAEDVFQEAARSVYERLETRKIRFQSKAHLRNYFFQTLRNLAINSLRDPRIKKTKNLDKLAPVESKQKEPFELVSQKEQSWFIKRRNMKIQKVISNLKPMEQEAIKLRYIQGLGFREMAERTGTALSTLQARVEAALKKIRKKIGKHGSGV